MTRISIPGLALALFLATPLAAQDSTVAAQQDVAVEMVIARDIVERMPVDSASTFRADIGRVACWTRVSGAAGTTIHHVWIHDGQEFPVPMQIGGSPWRVWSTKVIQSDWTGDWRVEVRNASGTVLATASFTITPAAAAPLVAEPQPEPAPPPQR